MFTKTLKFPFLWHKVTFQSRSIGCIAIALLIVTGSTSMAFSKLLAGHFSPFSLLFVSELIVVIFTLLSFGFFPLLKEIRHIKRKMVLPLALVGISSSIIAPLLFFSGIRITEAINAELFLQSHTFFLFFLASFLLREKIKRTDIYAVFCIFLGLLVVVLRGFEQGIQFSPGDFLIFSGALMYAVGASIFKKYLSSLHPEIVIFVRGLIAVMFFLIIAPFTQHTLLEEALSLPVQLFGVLLAYGFFSRFLHLFSFYEAMERLPAHTVSLMLPLITVGSLIFSHMYLNETIRWYHVVGGMLILFGSVIMQFSSFYFKGKHLERHLKHNFRHHV